MKKITWYEKSKESSVDEFEMHSMISRLQLLLQANSQQAKLINFAATAYLKFRNRTLPIVHTVDSRLIDVLLLWETHSESKSTFRWQITTKELWKLATLLISRLDDLTSSSQVESTRIEIKLPQLICQTV